MDMRPALNAPPESWVAQIAANAGTDVATYMREGPGLSAFVRKDGVVYHTYSAYGRDVDAIWGNSSVVVKIEAVPVDVLDGELP